MEQKLGIVEYFKDETELSDFGDMTITGLIEKLKDAFEDKEVNFTLKSVEISFKGLGNKLAITVKVDCSIDYDSEYFNNEEMFGDFENEFKSLVIKTYKYTIEDTLSEITI